MKVFDVSEIRNYDTEVGIYAQFGPWGGAVGYDNKNGPTGSVFQSVVVGPSADAWVSFSAKEGYEGVSVYGGAGLPSGTPSPVAANIQKNVETGDPFVTTGVTFYKPPGSNVGLAEAGLYIESGAPGPQVGSGLMPNDLGPFSSVASLWLASKANDVPSPLLDYPFDVINGLSSRPLPGTNQGPNMILDERGFYVPVNTTGTPLEDQWPVDARQLPDGSFVFLTIDESGTLVATVFAPGTAGAYVPVQIVDTGIPSFDRHIVNDFWEANVDRGSATSPLG